VFFGVEWFLLDYLSLQPRLSYERSFHPLTQPVPWYSLEENYYSAFGLELQSSFISIDKLNPADTKRYSFTVFIHYFMKTVTPN
tara:strand:+ start:12529 stop:12780 length:252 start_codon:yes stop_codon:yes gene_type:complete